MISFLDGEVVEKTPTASSLAVGGVGLRGAVPTIVLAALPAGGRALACTRGWSCARTR